MDLLRVLLISRRPIRRRKTFPSIDNGFLRVVAVSVSMQHPGDVIEHIAIDLVDVRESVFGRSARTIERQHTDAAGFTEFKLNTVLVRHLPRRDVVSSQRLGVARDGFDAAGLRLVLGVVSMKQFPRTLDRVQIAREVGFGFSTNVITGYDGGKRKPGNQRDCREGVVLHVSGSIVVGSDQSFKPAM